MKLRRLDKLNRAAVSRFTEVEKVTTLSSEELKRVIGGVEITAEAHSHYNYHKTSCAAGCGTDDMS